MNKRVDQEKKRTSKIRDACNDIFDTAYRLGTLAEALERVGNTQLSEELKTYSNILFAAQQESG